MNAQLTFRTASRRHLLVECPDLVTTMHLHENLEYAHLPGVVELIPAARTVLISFDPYVTSAATLRAAIDALDWNESAGQDAREVVIEVCYDGEDIAEVAHHLSVSVQQVITRHQEAHWQVAFSGFAPGFGYLACDDPFFNVPRRESPRTRVPVGSVALAGEFTGVYPRSSPGGWQLIGRSDANLWDLDREPPALFVPGTHVRFQQVERDTIVVEHAQVSGAAGTEGTDQGERQAEGAATSALDITVIKAGLQLLIQDQGRPGFAAMGVSTAGAADRQALVDANRLVGNTPVAAGLESCGGGAVLQFASAGVAAVTGAAGAITVTSAAGEVYLPAVGEPFAIEGGDQLELGPATAGMRRYVAFRGGIAARPVLGSASADTLAGLGPAALKPGDRVGLNPMRSAERLVDYPGVPGQGRGLRREISPGRKLPQAGDVVTMKVTLGPRDDWFTATGISTLLEQEWTVTHESDRVGLRLAGDTPLERARTGELPSEGAVTGALQVPPNGQPVLFGPDHPLTGGYPIIASVDDLGLAAQLAPGVRLRFTTDGATSPRPAEQRNLATTSEKETTQ